MKDPALAIQAAANAAGQSLFPNFSNWVPHSLAQGNAGLCVLWAYLDRCFPGEGWDVTGKAHLRLAARGAEHAQWIPPGLVSGVPGLAFAAHLLSRDGARYQRLLASLDEAIAAETLQLAARVKAADGMQVSDFDQITGLSGTGAYLLSRSEQPALYVALCNAVDALVELVIADQPVPRWHTPASCLFDDEARKAYPYGNLNCGLAHGLPGILAFLSLVRRSGVSVPEETGEGIDRAIETAATWMQAIRLDDAWGVNWPSAVPLEPEGEPGPDKPMRCGDPRRAAGGPARAAWCYGAPGIARALWLAGEARSRPEWKELAISAMEAVFRRPVPVRQIDSPTFCHGVAGLLAITLRFAADTGLQIFVEQADRLTHQMLDRFQPESLLGFRNIEYDNNETDQPGLLDGAAGVAIVLLSASTGIEPVWDRAFLLS